MKYVYSTEKVNNEMHTTSAAYPHLCLTERRLQHVHNSNMTYKICSQYNFHSKYMHQKP
jgi:hypothetical protein